MYAPDPNLQRVSPHVLLGYQLHNMRAFFFTATEQTVASAAKRLFVTPSAVSRSIHEFEKILGQKLFEHGPRGVLLTNYGRIVLKRAERIERELQLAVSELSQLKLKTGSPSLSAIQYVLFSGRKLQLLIRLADTSMLSAAAAEMNMRQSGASMALARIERSLGSRLFHREKRGMVPTKVADLLVLRAKRVFAEFRHMLSDIAEQSGQLQGWVSIGTSPLGRTLIVPSAIGAVLKSNPKAHITMKETAFDPLLVALQSGDIDAIIGVPRAESDIRGLIVEPLFTDRLTIFARSGHPLTRRSRLRLSNLIGERWILPRAEASNRTLFEACCRSRGLEVPLASVESADLGVIRQLLLTTDMLAVASTCQFHFEVRSGFLVDLPVSLTGTAREVKLLCREGAMLSATALALLDAIRTQSRLMELDVLRNTRVERLA